MGYTASFISFEEMVASLKPELKLKTIKEDLTSLISSGNQYKILNENLNQIVNFRIKLDELIKSIYSEKTITAGDTLIENQDDYSLRTITTFLRLEDPIKDGDIEYFKNFKKEINTVYMLYKTELNKLI